LTAWTWYIGAVIDVRFHNCRKDSGEAGFAMCDLEIVGDWIPFLPVEKWQDVVARSDDELRLALVRLDVSVDREPGFRIFVLDSGRKAVLQSSRIDGYCREIWWSRGGGVGWKSSDGRIGVFELR
jgi:hypothetical protein